MRGVLVRGLGMVTCVGRSASASCAAQRAGISRRRPLPEFSAADETELEVPVYGAAASPLTDGFYRFAVWIRLARRCLEELADEGGADTSWSETPVIWVLPDAASRLGLPDSQGHAVMQREFVEGLKRLAPLPLQSMPDSTLCHGSTGVAEALEIAARELYGGHSARVLVVAVDSLVERETLAELMRERRVKTPEQPLGLCPGEAAAALVLERPDASTLHQVQTRSRISAWAVSAPPGSLDPEEPARTRAEWAPQLGREFALAVRRALSEAQVSTFVGDVIVDLNGEVWKAVAWGHALPLLADTIELGRCRTIVPATSFGDTGAASGLIGVGVAVRSFARSYALGAHALVCSIDDSGRSAAVLVSRG